jgi:PAS domain S-box-containing protein
MSDLRCLLLEDNPLDAEVVRVTLTDGGIDCEIQVVETRPQFADALATQPVDLILADYALPGFDGLRALAMAQHQCPEVPFIFVTATMGEELAIESLKQGATDYVLKQRLQRLVPCVQRALQATQERRACQQTMLALQASEALHRALFDSMDEGCCLLERLPPPPDGRRDYRYLAMNRAMQTMFGLADLSGQSMRDHFLDEVEAWYDTYDQVLETGIIRRCELPLASRGMVLDIYVTPVEDGAGKRLLTVVKDITERTRREANLALLADISRDFAEAHTPDALMQVIGARLSRHLNLASGLFAEINERQDQVTVLQTWQTAAMLDPRGTYALIDFIGPGILQAIRSGDTIVIGDTQTDRRVVGDAFVALKVRANITVPCHHQGQWKYVFAVNDVVARDWRTDEVELIQEVTSRLFPRLERAYAEAALAASEQRYRRLVELSPQLVWRGNWQHHTYVSPQFVAYTGLQPEQLTGFDWSEVLHPEDVDRVHSLWQKSLETGVPYQAEYRLRRHDGEYRWHMAQAVPTSKGPEAEWFGVSTDIHNRKQLELALGDSEARLSRIFANVGAAIGEVLIDSDRTYSHQFISVGCEAIYGYSQAEISDNAGLWQSRILPADWETVILPAYEQIFAEATFTIEYRFRDPTNTLRWISETIVSQRDEAVDGWRLTIVATNITLRKQAATALKKQEALLHSIYTGVEQAIFVVNVTGNHDFRYVALNPTAEKITGLSQNFVQGKTPEAAFGAMQGAAFRRNYQRCLRANASITYEEEFVFAHHQIWTLTTLTPLRNRAGKIYRLIVTAIDITDRKRAELEQQQSEATSRAILAAMPDLLIRFSAEGVYREVICTGLTSTVLSKHAIGQSIFEVLPADLAQLSYEYIKRALQTHELQVFQQEIQLGDRIQYEDVRAVASGDDEVLFVIRDVSDLRQAELSLQRQIRQEYLLADIALEIRQSLDLAQVLHTTVERVREWLACDRVIIFRFRPDWQGDVMMESVADGWDSMLSANIFDPCLAERFVEPYCQGYISVLNDIRQPGLDHLLRRAFTAISGAGQRSRSPGAGAWPLGVAHGPPMCRPPPVAGCRNRPPQAPWHPGGACHSPGRTPSTTTARVNPAHPNATGSASERATATGHFRLFSRHHLFAGCPK